MRVSAKLVASIIDLASIWRKWLGREKILLGGNVADR